MPGNIIRINNCDDLEWYVGDSKMKKLISKLNKIGFKTQDENESDADKHYRLHHGVSYKQFITIAL